VQHEDPEEVGALLLAQAPAGLCVPERGREGGREGAQCLQLLSTHSGTRRREK